MVARSSKRVDSWIAKEGERTIAAEDKKQAAVAVREVEASDSEEDKLDAKERDILAPCDGEDVEADATSNGARKLDRRFGG